MKLRVKFWTAFGFIKNIIYIGFSEGLKFAFYTAAKRNDVAAILSCNGLCVEETHIEKINRPRIKNEKMVYDSNYGTWVNWSIVEKYKEYFIDSSCLDQNIDYFGVYSTDDNLSENSRAFWMQKQWPLELIPQADHLYTKDVWVQKLIDILVQWHCEKIRCTFAEESEFFLHTGKNRICIKLLEKEQSSVVFSFCMGCFRINQARDFCLLRCPIYFGVNTISVCLIFHHRETVMEKAKTLHMILCKKYCYVSSVFLNKEIQL